VLAAYPKAFLGIGNAWMGCLPVAEEIILKLVHACVGEHQSRVVLHYYWCRRHNLVAFGSEKIQKGAAYLGTGHHNKRWFFAFYTLILSLLVLREGKGKET
jgi:hypothetical protein